MDTSAAPMQEVPEFFPPEMADTGVVYASPFAEPQMKRRRRRVGRKGKGTKTTKGKGMRKSRRRRRRAKVPEERLRRVKVLPASSRYIHPYYMPMHF